MKSKKIIVFSVLVILGILFGITSCKNYLLDTKKTTININLDLSKLIKTSRSDSTQNTEYILKIFVYDASNNKEGVKVEKQKQGFYCCGRLSDYVCRCCFIRCIGQYIHIT